MLKPLCARITSENREVSEATNIFLPTTRRVNRTQGMGNIYGALSEGLGASNGRMLSQALGLQLIKASTNNMDLAKMVVFFA